MGGVRRGGMGARSGWVTRWKGRAGAGIGVGWLAAPEAGASGAGAGARAPAQAGEAGATSASRSQARRPARREQPGPPVSPAARRRSRGDGRSSGPATASSGETPQAARPPRASQSPAQPPASCAPAACPRAGTATPAPRVPGPSPAAGSRAGGREERRCEKRGPRRHRPLVPAPRGEGTAASAASPRAPCAQFPSSRATRLGTGATPRGERCGRIRPGRPAGLRAAPCV